MTDIPIKVVVDCATKEVSEIPLTSEEIAANELAAANALAIKEAEEAEAQRIADLKASAKAKLIAGQPLTEEEASVLVI